MPARPIRGVAGETAQPTPRSRRWRWCRSRGAGKLRQTLFWVHLSTGVLGGTVIAVMAVTGALLAFERQVLAYAERAVRTVALPAPGTARLDLDTLLARAQAALPGETPSGVTLRAAPHEAVMIHFGRDRVLFVHPYTGAVLDTGATTWRSAFRVLTDWHRWLALEGEYRDLGRAMTGACNAAFAGLVGTGLYLWWPRRWSRQALRAIARPRLSLRGKARDWNWHHAVGCWSAVALLCITLTGLVMSYPWANNLLYTLTGNTPPSPRPPQGAEERPAATARRQREADAVASPVARARLEMFVTAATRQTPHWRSLTLRLPPRPAPRLQVVLEEATSLHPYPRSQLTLDATSAAVLQWEPYAGANLGHKLRSWVRPLHTGEALGPLGQTLAMLASAGGVVLVWTGVALAWRRFFGAA